jgi:hypothetical protein
MQEPDFTTASIDLAIRLWMGLSLPDDADVNPMGWFLMGAGIPPVVSIKLSEALYVDSNRDECNEC